MHAAVAPPGYPTGMSDLYDGGLWAWERVRVLAGGDPRPCEWLYGGIAFAGLFILVLAFARA